MQLQSITHYLDSNTLEAVWIEAVLDDQDEIIAFRRCRCEAYSAAQKAQFESDVGTVGPAYTALAGW